MLKNSLYGKIESGIDESGRGSLSGSVFAAAVILPVDYHNKRINDSKKLSPKVRYELREEIEREALAFAVADISSKRIEKINILNATFEAMNKAILKLCIEPEILLIDGNRFKTTLNIPFECIIKGDAKIMSIAAASILAKTYREDYMQKIHEKYPMYGWEHNSGYPTAEHIKAIKDYGITPYHRKTFRGVKERIIL